MTQDSVLKHPIPLLIPTSLDSFTPQNRASAVEVPLPDPVAHHPIPGPDLFCFLPGHLLPVAIEPQPDPAEGEAARRQFQRGRVQVHEAVFLELVVHHDHKRRPTGLVGVCGEVGTLGQLFDVGWELQERKEDVLVRVGGPGVDEGAGLQGKDMVGGWVVLREEGVRRRDVLGSPVVK